MKRATRKALTPWRDVAQQAWKATGYRPIARMAKETGMSRSTMYRLLDGKTSADAAMVRAFLTLAYGPDAKELIEDGLESHHVARGGQADNRRKSRRLTEDGSELRASHLGPFLRRTGVVADARVVVEIGSDQYGITDAVYDRNTNTFVLYPHWMHREELR